MSLELDIKTINLIAEYIKTPANDIYRDYLYKQISENESALEYLKSQETVFSDIKTVDIPDMPASTFPTIEKDLTKIARQQKIIEQFANIKNFVVTGIVIMTGILSYLTVVDFINNKNVENNIQQEAVINVSNSDVNAVSVQTKKSDISNIKSNIDTKAENLKNNIVSFGEDNEREHFNTRGQVYGYSGDIKNYKTIQDVDISSDMLLLAEREIGRGVVDLAKVDNYLYRAMLSGHKVDVIIKRDDQ